MGIISGYKVNSTESKASFLIVSQGSEFKKELTQNIVSHFKSRSIYIEIVDVTTLPKVKENEWDAIVVIHTWEYLLPHKNVQSFIDRLTSTDNIIVVTTSSLGNESLEEIDGISAASISSEVDLVTSQVIGKVEMLLKKPLEVGSE
jgi:hypothetical protein